MDNDLIDEIIALGAVRLQKVYVLEPTVLVLELYSPAHKKLFFVFDTGATKSLHVQLERPMGAKIKPPLVLLLHKYGAGRSIRFLKIDNKNESVKACFSYDNHDYCLMFYLFSNYTVGLFKNAHLLASLGHQADLQYRDGFLQGKPAHSLDKNLVHAQLYQAQRHINTADAAFSYHVGLLKKRIQKKQALIKNIERDLEHCRQDLLLEHDAELLRAHLHVLKKGDKEIVLPDYTSHPPTMRTIKIDPRLSPKELLQKAFLRIKKAKRGIAIIEPRLALIKNEFDDLMTELNGLHEKGLSLLPPQKSLEHHSPQKIKKTTKRLPFRSFRSSDGIKILVGRSAQDSDDLSMHYAHGNDWWFHVEHQPGAHVVVKSNAEALPEKTFLEACLLAQHFSKARDHESATINYTKAKHVKKPKGLAKGLVLISQEKRFVILRNDAMLDALLISEIHLAR